MLEMGPKPFELRISKRPGGRHFERYPRAPPSSPAPPPPSFPALPCPLSSRPPALFTRAPALTRPAPRPRSPRGRIPTDRYNWSIFSVFVDLAYFFQRSYNNKWLVVRTNHIAYYADVTETAPQEVLLLDRFTKVRPRRWPFFPVVAAPNPSWTHPTAHHRPQGDGLGPRPAGVQRLPRARRAHAQPASRPGPGQGHQHRARSPKSVVFIRLPFPTVCVLIQILSLLVSSTGEWCKPHPHDSFAPVRTAQGARWLVDGANYFGAVADAIMGARRTIYIADWWLSPEVGASRLEFSLGDWR